MKVVAIVQARMGSSRLPGKVLREISGKSMLMRVLERLQRACSLDEILVATTDASVDDVIEQECRRLLVPLFRGSEEDVLDRYMQAARWMKADVVTRITSDCPLIDPEITDSIVRAFLAQRPDYASNTLDRTYPRGLDAEVMSFHTLERAWRDANQPYQREHVTPYICEHPEEFKLLSISADRNNNRHRWTVDTQEDMEFVRAIYARLGGRAEFSWQDILALLEREPELAEINGSIAQKELQAGR